MCQIRCGHEIFAKKRKYFLTFLDIEVLQSAAPAVPGDQVELDKPGADLGAGAEGEGEDWEGVGLLPGVLQCLEDHLVPGPRLVETDRHLELLGSPVPVTATVGVDQLHQVEDLVAAEVQHELGCFMVRAQPVVLGEDLLVAVGQQLRHGERLGLTALRPLPVLLRHHPDFLLRTF